MKKALLLVLLFFPIIELGATRRICRITAEIVEVPDRDPAEYVRSQSTDSVRKKLAALKGISAFDRSFVVGMTPLETELREELQDAGRRGVDVQALISELETGVEGDATLQNRKLRSAEMEEYRHAHD